MLFFLGSSSFLLADEAEFLLQSQRARGMGNAFTAVANDEMALFYNPAGLRSVQHNIYTIGTLGGAINQNVIDVGQAIADASSSDDQENAVLSELGNIPGKKTYAEFNFGGLSITTPSWGYTLFGNAVIDFTVNNPTVPFFDVKAYAQAGIVSGYAMSFLDQTLDLGVGFKVVQRTGINKTIRISDESITEALNKASEGEDGTSELIRDSDSVIRFVPDVGAMYHMDSIPNLHTKFGLVVQNIGNLDFGDAGQVPMIIHTGVSTESTFAGWDILLAADFQDVTNQLTNELSTMRRLKLGTEFGFCKLFNGHHLFSLRTGLNGGYLTYGISFNFFGAKLDLTQWSEEIGEVAGDLEDKRYSIQGSLIF